MALSRAPQPLHVSGNWMGGCGCAVQVTVDGESHSMSLRPEVWDSAESSRAKRLTARLPPSCKFYNIYGTGAAAAAGSCRPRAAIPCAVLGWLQSNC